MKLECRSTYCASKLQIRTVYCYQEIGGGGRGEGFALEKKSRIEWGHTYTQ